MKQLPDFKDCIFYEIYPNSFMDSDGDGFGDLKGILSKLDYIQELGCNAIWLNPIYDSPFKDGGYDVRDQYKVSSRYGTNEDLKTLITEMHSRGMRLFLDLVPGHMSIENKEFLRSAEGKPNEDYDLFIWNDNPWNLENGYRLISGCYDRNGCYMVNFFAHQPAINYGFNKIEYPSWQKSYKETKRGKEYLEKIMRYWLSYDIDGFRVDMANSLVKNDGEDKKGTIALWQEIRKDLREDGTKEFYMTSEWSVPDQSLEADFDSDFCLDWVTNCTHRLWRQTEDGFKYPLFHKYDEKLYDLYLENFKFWIKSWKEGKGRLSFISGNHDTTRIANFLNEEELKLAYLYLFTMPGVPYIYYGDEIGMHADLSLPSFEGGYQRTGTRSPMRWNSKKNAGFSTADKTFLPTNEKDSTVEEEMKDENSLWNVVHALIKLRNEDGDLRGDDFELLNEKIAYKRGKDLVVINILDDEQIIDVPANAKIIFSLGDAKLKDGKLHLAHHGAAIVR